MKKIKIVMFAVVVIAIAALNVRTVLNSNRPYDLNMTTIAAISGEDDSDDGESSGGGGGFCYSGGVGSGSCSIDAGTDILGSGISGGCSVSCNSGYYACCSLRCVCHKI